MKNLLRQAYYIAAARQDVYISGVMKNALLKDYGEINLL